MVYTLGVDIGATKVRATVFSKKTPLVTNKIVHNNKDILKKICICIDQVLAQNMSKRMTRIGVAVPGTVTNNKLNTAPNAKSLLDHNLAVVLEQRYKAKTFLINDADAFVLGCANGDKSKQLVIAGATFGTGLGVGVITNGKLQPNVGELGQFQFRSDTKSKKIEDRVNGKAYQTLLQSKYVQNVADVLELIQRAYLPQTIYVGGSLLRIPAVYKAVKKQLRSDINLQPSNENTITLGAILYAKTAQRQQKKRRSNKHI